MSSHTNALMAPAQLKGPHSLLRRTSSATRLSTTNAVTAALTLVAAMPLMDQQAASRAKTTCQDISLNSTHLLSEMGIVLRLVTLACKHVLLLITSKYSSAWQSCIF